MECTDRTQRMWLERGEAIGRWLEGVAGRLARAARWWEALAPRHRSGARTSHGSLLR